MKITENEDVKYKILREIEKNMTGNEKEVLYSRSNNETLSAISKKLNLSNERIRQIESKSIRKLMKIAQSLEIHAMTVFEVFFRKCSAPFPEFYAIEILYKTLNRENLQKCRNIIDELAKHESRLYATESRLDDKISKIPDLDMLQQCEKTAAPFMKNLRDYEIMLRDLEAQHRNFWSEQTNNLEKYIDKSVRIFVTDIINTRFKQITDEEVTIESLKQRF